MTAALGYSPVTSPLGDTLSPSGCSSCNPSPTSLCPGPSDRLRQHSPQRGCRSWRMGIKKTGPWGRSQGGRGSEKPGIRRLGIREASTCLTMLWSLSGCGGTDLSHVPESSHVSWWCQPVLGPGCHLLWGLGRAKHPAQ